nr:MAG TPA: hypothetical protein [Caudoviricetes sp.]
MPSSYFFPPATAATGATYLFPIMIVCIYIYVYIYFI